MSSIFRSTGSGPKRQRSRGQVVVIFAGAAILFMLLCAAVVDISWYWTNNLRIQRAADAAALAGVVFLPGSPPGNTAPAFAAAKAEATKNGYTDGTAGFTVVPEVDPLNNRRIHVTIKGPVGTFFARVVGINSWPAQRDARADFVLPVPMGSPQNYYGVSALYGTTPVVTVHDAFTDKTSGTDIATTSPAGNWTSIPTLDLPGGVAATDAKYITTKTTNNTVQFGGFGLTSGLNAGESITSVNGLQVTVTGAKLSAACAGTTNKILVALSWDKGVTWTNVVALTGNLTTTAATSTFGSNLNTSFWTAHTTWQPNEINDTNFRLRLTASKACGTGSVELRVDQIQVQAWYTTNTPFSTTSSTDDPTVRPVPDPATAVALASQGFWGAAITSGGERGNGDRYGPAYNGNPAANAEYDGKGYDYTVEVGAGGRVSLYDATFCATGPNLSSGLYGAGDHYIGAVGPVTTVFTLFDTKGTPYNLGDDTQVATSGGLFAGEQQRDYSHNYGEPGGADADCGASIYHNKWWSLATGLAAGTYRLNVSTAAPGNINTSAENMWSVWASGGAKPRVYGGGRMVAYTNLSAGTSKFYLAQIPKEHAGKTMFIDLFDPGDVAGNGSLRIQSPDGNAYTYTNFSYTADNGKSGTNVSSVQTAIAGVSQFNNSVMTITIALPSTYGSVGLTPPGETEAGWWKIEYTVGGGNDTTTWAVSIRGNPVHLILP